MKACVMGEHCDCIYNCENGCAAAALPEVVEDMACLTVCWAYKQRVQG